MSLVAHRTWPRWSHIAFGGSLLGFALLVVIASVSGCVSSCDPAVVPMPEGFEDVSFNSQPDDVLRRGATAFGKRLIVWHRGAPMEMAHRHDQDAFRSYYERCADTSLCDEVSYNFEGGEGGYSLTLVRFGGPLLSVWETGALFARSATERCAGFKELGRALWGAPTREELEGRLEVFEINSRVWGAVLCTGVGGGELFVGQARRIEEIFR